jgi:hypothetical protein
VVLGGRRGSPALVALAGGPLVFVWWMGCLLAAVGISAARRRGRRVAWHGRETVLSNCCGACYANAFPKARFVTLRYTRGGGGRNETNVVRVAGPAKAKGVASRLRQQNPKRNLLIAALRREGLLD